MCNLPGSIGTTLSFQLQLPFVGSTRHAEVDAGGKSPSSARSVDLVGNRVRLAGLQLPLRVLDAGAAAAGFGRDDFHVVGRDKAHLAGSALAVVGDAVLGGLRQLVGMGPACVEHGD